MVVNLVVMTRSVPKPSLSRGTMQIGMAATAPVLPMPLLQMAAIAPLRRHLLRTWTAFFALWLWEWAYRK